MEHPHVTDEVLEHAALHALGTLDPDDLIAYEAHLADGCEICAEELQAFESTVVQIAATVRPCVPRPSVRDQLFAKIASGELIARSSEGVWEPGTIPGLFVKRLGRDLQQGRYVALVRLEPSRGPAAGWMTSIEEMFVLEGSVRIAGQILGVGAFYAAPAGSVREVLGGADGCLCLILSPEIGETSEGARQCPDSAAPYVLHAAEGSWNEGFVPGMTQRTLFADSRSGTVTALVRMSAGCELPPHRHELPEQLFIVEGDALIENEALQKGDFYRIDGGTVHQVTTTRGGCVFLLLHSSLPAAA